MDRRPAYARLHLASTVLVVLAVLLVPAGTGGAAGVLLPAAWGYVAVQAVARGGAPDVVAVLRPPRTGLPGIRPCRRDPL